MGNGLSGGAANGRNYKGLCIAGVGTADSRREGESLTPDKDRIVKQLQLAEDALFAGMAKLNEVKATNGALVQLHAIQNHLANAYGELERVLDDEWWG